MAATNKAAYQPAQKANALEVRTAPYTPPGAGQIVVKNAAVAINPIDWLIQSRGDIMFTHLKYPFVLGSDLSGEVVELGKDVTRFQVGDRVLAFARATDQKVNDAAQGAFQNYTIIRADLASLIPSTIPYETVAVLPLGISTASAGLFEKSTLNLELPTEPARLFNGQTVIIWGGSTSVGCNAIQLAVAAGYEVFSTASPKNHAYLKKLGASQVFDYRSATVAEDMISALKGKSTAGALSIGSGAAEKCMQILDKSTGSNKFVAMATFPVPEKEPQSFVLLRTAIFFVTWLIAYKLKGLIKGIKSTLIRIDVNSGVSKHIFVDFLPKALQNGSYVAAPEPEVTGRGLESIQEAFNLKKKGVSAKKIVVSL
jgi:NADPH:quinone reductase-like Zn-dependent oxidoreductase